MLEKVYNLFTSTTVCFLNWSKNINPKRIYMCLVSWLSGHFYGQFE